MTANIIKIAVNSDQCTTSTAVDTVEEIIEIMRKNDFSDRAQEMASNVLLESSLNVLKHNVNEMLPYAGYKVEIDPLSKRCSLSCFGYILPKQKIRMMKMVHEAHCKSKEEIKSYLSHMRGTDYPTVTGDISSGSGILTQIVDSEGKPELTFDSKDTLIVTRRNGKKQQAEKFELTIEICKGIEIPRIVTLANTTSEGRAVYQSKLEL